jgi:hypothetical protein
MTDNPAVFELSNSELIDSFRARSKQYQSAEPYPHACFDQLISTDFLEKVLVEFPGKDEIE